MFDFLGPLYFAKTGKKIPAQTRTWFTHRADGGHGITTPKAGGRDEGPLVTHIQVLYPTITLHADKLQPCDRYPQGLCLMDTSFATWFEARRLSSPWAKTKQVARTGAAAVFLCPVRNTSVPFRGDNLAHRDATGMVKPPFRSMSYRLSRVPLSVIQTHERVRTGTNEGSRTTVSCAFLSARVFILADLKILL